MVTVYLLTVKNGDYKNIEDRICLACVNKITFVYICMTETKRFSLYLLFLYYLVAWMCNISEEAIKNELW